MKQENIDRCNAHAARIRAAFPKCRLDGVTLCRALRRLEREAHAYCERSCNTGEDDAEFEALVVSNLRFLLGDNSAPVFLNGDPRGYALKVRAGTPQAALLPQDWGGYGLLAPGFNEGGRQ